MHKTARIDVSTKAAVIHYLRSIHVSAKGVVIQRGLRNYAGAHCPGKGWTCASTRHTVVQIAKRGGLNRFACRTVKCAVVQFGGASRGLRSFAASRAPKPPPPPNTALCVKTTGVTQSCVINQPNASGTNQAIVWMVTPKNTGLTQSSYYSASITQGPASAAGSSNNNIACVNQFVWLDGSTTKTNTAGTTVTNDNHLLITINQNSLTGANTVQGATPSGSSYACGASGSSLTQGELLTSIVNSKGGSITQNQDTQPSTTNCDPYDANVSGCANVVTDIEQNQNQAGGFKGSATGVNSANFAQSTRQIAVANTPSGTVTQQQNANVPAAPYSGVVGTINQDSKAQSTAVVTQDEKQCQDSVSQSTPIPAPTSSATTGPGSAACPVVDGAGHDVGVPPGVTLKQTQYGPLGVGTPPKKKRGPGFFHTKGYGQSQQTNAGPNVFDQFTLTQTSSQKQDEPGPNVTLKQVNTIKGDCKSSGDTSATGGACAFAQSATLNGVTNGTTTDGYTAGQIGGTGGTPLVITCTNGHTTCQATPPPAPVIDAGSKPSNPSESRDVTFTWTEAATAGVTLKCSIDGGTTFTTCDSPTSTSYSGLALGSHTFVVKAVDNTASHNESGTDSYTWTVVPYLTFEKFGTGSSAGWSSVPGTPITLVVGTDSGSYGQFTLHNFEGIALSDLPAEPTFTTDVYHGAPRYEIDLDNGDYLFGYPPQAGFGPNSWDINCGGSNLSCADQAFVTWADVLTAEGSATVSDVLIEADSNPGDTYNISAFSFDGFGLSDFTNHWHNG